MKKKLLYLASIIIFCFILILSYKLLIENKKGNGFNRSIKSEDFQIVNVFKFPPSLFYFAGISKRELFFKDLANVNKLFSIDYTLSNSHVHDLKLPLGFDLKKRVTIGVVDTLIYVVENETGALTLISKETGKKQSFKSPVLYLRHAHVLSNKSIIAKNLLPKKDNIERLLSKVNYEKGVVENTYRLEAQNNNLFSTDGSLNYDLGDLKLYYMYFYRGEFVCLDTNLKVLFKSKTIDTVTTAKITTAKSTKHLSSKKQTTFTQATPPVVVNLNSTLYNKCLYIMSALQADNETSSNFRKNQIVDVYSVDNGKYLYSFYIPKYKGKKPREFRITNDSIFATYDQYLVRYKRNT